MSNQKAAVLEQLINKGRFREARRQATALDEGSESAGFYFWAALAEILDPWGSGVWAVRYITAARDAKDYAPILEVDILRDQAQLVLKKAEIGKALGLVKSSHDLLHDIENMVTPAAWANRVAVLTMVLGRINLAMGNATEAEKLHREADQQFRELKDQANKQWELNNGFHWLRAAAAQGTHVNWRVAQFGWIPKGDPNRIRRIRAHLLMQFGRFAYRLDDRIVHRLFG